MIFLMDCTIKTSVILLIALSAVQCLRRSSAAVRHGILSAAVVCAAIVPIAASLMPSWSLGPASPASPFLPEIYAELHSSTPTGAAPSPVLGAPAARSIPAQLPGLIWIAGAAAGLLLLITGWMRIARFAWFSEEVLEGRWIELCEAISRQYGLRRRVRLLRAQNPAILATWGVLRPKILLPSGSENWPDDRVRAVLGHELAHIRRRDWLIQTMAEALRVAYWFNPLLWIACSRLRLESEYACDNAVLADGIAGLKYAAALLEVVRALHQGGTPRSAALDMARPSTVESRFAAMLNPQVNRRPVTRYAIATIVAAALAVTLPVAMWSSSSRPQASSGTIVGIVSDNNGERVAGAWVVVYAPDGRIKGTALTRPDGVFQYSGLAPGSYQIQAFQSAIGASRRTSVALQPSQELWQDLKMDIGVANAPESPIQAIRPHDYKGKPISMSLKKDVKDVVRLIAGSGDLDVKFDSGVSAAMTVQVRNMPWDEVLDIVMTDARLKSELHGKTLQIGDNPIVEQEILPLRIVTIGGRVTEFQLQNPSTFLKVEALNDEGTTRVWRVRWASASQLSSGGLTANTVHIGDHVVITGAVEETASEARIRLIDIKRPANGFRWGGRPWITYSTPSDTAMFVMSGHR